MVVVRDDVLGKNAFSFEAENNEANKIIIGLENNREPELQICFQRVEAEQQLKLRLQQPVQQKQQNDWLQLWLLKQVRSRISAGKLMLPAAEANG